MAKNVTLKDRSNNEAVYPQTTVNNITDLGAWVKSSTKPSYSLSEVGATMTSTAITTATSSSCNITGSGNVGKSETIVYTNSTASDIVVTVPTTYKTPDGAALEITCKAGGYCEVNYINIGGVIYARGA
jgi:hypothetical protein